MIIEIEMNKYVYIKTKYEQYKNNIFNKFNIWTFLYFEMIN